MIVSSGFQRHWKTQMLKDLLNDPAAPCYVLTLWSNCYDRRTCLFESAKLTPAILKAITYSPADKEVLWKAFFDSGFLDLHKDGTIEAHGFYDENREMFMRWENGKKGGRPRKEKPNDNRTITEEEPREEKERKERNEKQGETGKEETALPFSPAPRKKSFWYGKDYSKAEIPEIRSYEDIRRIQDPVIACMAVSGDRSKGMYGFLAKGLRKCLDAGLSEETLKDCLFDLCARLFGEQKAGERPPGKIAPALVAEMKEYFRTVDLPYAQYKEAQ